jgi:hypothetical protein
MSVLCGVRSKPARPATGSNLEARRVTCAPAGPSSWVVAWLAQLAAGLVKLARAGSGLPARPPPVAGSRLAAPRRSPPPSRLRGQLRLPAEPRNGASPFPSPGRERDPGPVSQPNREPGGAGTGELEFGVWLSRLLASAARWHAPRSESPATATLVVGRAVPFRVTVLKRRQLKHGDHDTPEVSG